MKHLYLLIVFVILSGSAAIAQPLGVNETGYGLTIRRGTGPIALGGRVLFDANQINNVNTNIRFQWWYKPVSDLFVVHTDNYFAYEALDRTARATPTFYHDL